MADKQRKTLSLTAIDNINGVGSRFTEMQGYIEDNKPSIPYVEVRFYTKAVVGMLFSETKQTGQRKGKLQRQFIHGADWFNSKMHNVLQAIKEDDPFADQLLLNIEDEVEALGNELQRIQAELKNQLEKRLSPNNASIIFNDNMHCISVHITYENRISYDLLWALKELDNVFYYLYLNDKYAAMDPKDIKQIRNETRSNFRRCMTRIHEWVPTSITREDIAHNTARVATAWEKNAAINLTREVLFMEQRAKSAPNIPTRAKGELDEITQQKLDALFA